MRWLLCSALLLAGCHSDRTVVVVSVPGADGREVPAAGQILVMLPYDRDSVLAQISAPWVAARPDTAPLGHLLDSLRNVYARYLSAAPAERAAARATLDAALAKVGDRLTLLRAAQHDWQDSAYRTYDSLTFALTERLARDPFADTTDAYGVAVVSPSRSGPWWVTVTAWDAADPYSEWYWNRPLSGDTLHLNVANAHHRRRY
jgi:hypothetical protein